jgi:pyruvate-formate lyase-activating enzyme
LSANAFSNECRSYLQDGDDAPSPSLLAPRGLRLIQVQPTLNCNLRCRHCYSESGPGKTKALAIELLQAFLREARSLGYGYVGLSGGEPLLWAGWAPFLQDACELGFSTAVVTNGTLLTPARARDLKKWAGVVAVSVDGPPAEHAAMRGSASAFVRMVKGLAVLRAEGVRFVLVFTLTRTNADRLSWLYEFADEVGAFAVEIHPLCNFGAAAVNLPGDIPDSLEFRTAAWLLALLSVQRGTGGPGVVMDVFRRHSVEASAWPLLAGRERTPAAVTFSDLVPSLIVEPDGCVTPLIYGFPRRWAVSVLGQQPLAEAAAAWQTRCVEPVAEIVQATLARLAGGGEDYIDLFGQILTTAHRAVGGLAHAPAV